MQVNLTAGRVLIGTEGYPHFKTGRLQWAVSVGTRLDGVLLRPDGWHNKSVTDCCDRFSELLVLPAENCNVKRIHPESHWPESWLKICP